MSGSGSAEERVLRTTARGFPLHEYRLGLAGREWRVLHTGAVPTHANEPHFVREPKDRLPYGVALWPAAIALAHEVAARAAAGHRHRVGRRARGADGPAGDGDLRLPAQRGAERGGEIESRLVGWADWDDDGRYDWIVGSDVLYGESMHPHLRGIIERCRPAASIPALRSRSAP